ncbi:MAG: Ku protein [Propionibacteriaceae bacterium]|uniref:Non-homologous end joining protein Ku n=1 Tax=Brooklawnia propionicigenes TaxID=3041175 RepID=A0AAN0KBI0_9ACTN|nr:Ku protein [Brooklawnia sp. SH051]MCB0883271.1 Ku protein [Propionibacteriaceae bacterium]MEA5120734.1 Ku protein [Propionibacterium sp.]NLI85626.1 Ku protein [Propionibacterium sp.]BEH03427.1 Ku protein [Brooklawnia sp. SH051]
MPRAMWEGAVSFGLIVIPVKLYGATEPVDVPLHQVHGVDGGRIRYRRVCEICGQEVPYDQIDRGYTAADGRVVVLTKQDLEQLPLASKGTVEISTFVDESEIDPVYFEKTYLIEAKGVGVKPYVLLRDALAKTGKAGVVKVALRTRESLALIRPRGDLLVMDTMLWPDEVRDPSFAAPDTEVHASPAEVTMAETFIGQMSGHWEPSEYTDSYRAALEALVTAKLEGATVPEPVKTEGGGEVVDLMAALRASVEAAKKRGHASSGKSSGSDKDEAAAG